MYLSEQLAIKNLVNLTPALKLNANFTEKKTKSNPLNKICVEPEFRNFFANKSSATHCPKNGGSLQDKGCKNFVGILHLRHNFSTHHQKSPSANAEPSALRSINCPCFVRFRAEHPRIKVI
jgi:hypothetical protein